MSQNYISQAAILLLVQASYPGGQDAFVEDGGIIDALPWGELLILVPSNGSKLKELLQSGQEKYGARVQFVDTLSYDRGDMSDEEVQEEIQRVTQALAPLLVKHKTDLIINDGMLALTVVLPIKDPTPEALKDITDVIKSFKGLRRAAICWMVDHVWIDFGETKQIVLEAAKKDTPINERDVADIGAMLKDVKSVEDFLKNM
jgi:hypothetical protein